MELQLERSRRLADLGSMAAGIAHEVRNPLGTLRGLAYFFGAENGASDACKNYYTSSATGDPKWLKNRQ